jgi:hypothetical protein
LRFSSRYTSFLDESGDLGFTDRASRHFLIAAIVTDNKTPLEKCITKVRKQRLPKKYRNIPELKFQNSSKEIKRRLLECLATSNIEIAYALLRKQQVYEELRNKQNILYNYLCGSLISKIFQRHHIQSSTELIVDKSLNGITQEAFNDYIGWRAVMSHPDPFDVKLLKIKHIDSRQEKGIQAADFVAGAIARRCEHSDSAFCKIIDTKITIALDYFEGRKR